MPEIRDFQSRAGGVLSFGLRMMAPLAVALGPGLNRLCAALVLTGLYGAGLEVAQMVGDAGREGSLLDIAANLSGALAGLIVVAMLRGDRPLFRGDNF